MYFQTEYLEGDKLRARMRELNDLIGDAITKIPLPSEPTVLDLQQWIDTFTSEESREVVKDVGLREVLEYPSFRNFFLKKQKVDVDKAVRIMVTDAIVDEYLSRLQARVTDMFINCGECGGGPDFEYRMIKGEKERFCADCDQWLPEYRAL